MLCAKPALAQEPHATASSEGNLWHSVALRFGEYADFLAPVASKAIVEEINWLKRNRNYLERVTRRSEPYAYHIVQR
ncbi:MAG: hypothetical protein HKO07_05305, partial [Pseudomonadales bacterium]|nr:hypothetical protein [Pseudomonadales bacterium]